MDNRQEQSLKDLNVSLTERLKALTIELQSKNRELEIEAALEKVRVRATSMRVSSELAETSAVLFQQLNELNIKAIRTGVGIFDDANDAMEIWLTTFSDSQEVIRILDYVNLHIHPVYENIIPARKQDKPYAVTILRGEQVRQYYQTMSTYQFLPQPQQYNSQEHFYSFFFSEGAINVITLDILTEEECNIMIRFSQVFGLIYTRFLDLQKAEARARDIKKQSSLDRVRGQIASMRSTSDLKHITPLIWNELITLGVPFTRCGIFIIDEKTEIAEVYLSAPDGHSLAVLKLPFQINTITVNIIDHWRRKAVYREHWTKIDFINWTQSMLQLGQINDRTAYQDASDPPEVLDLHFIPFTQGMLYIGNIFPLSEEEINIAESLAETFSVAYTRYEDFIILEKAKQNIETTLSELRSTQSLLIQSEKMASLGELTAGIAHEIQNPLNFVNNFSEVSAEMMEELQKEFIAGNQEEGVALVTDIKLNLEKILHHGQRADAIVKGMLQHTRSSTGIKEPTNINTLVDEYLRLAYHGLRAKDKTFNATIETNFDDSIGEIDIIPQDIGRVILNLINNAFYAVAEKKKEQPEGFESLVSVFTKKLEDNVSISVKDNGNGIPQQIADKIFQPFFTTKPAGQGTGLGLSLSYDIIKAHGGELQMKTKEGAGSEFIIRLPIVGDY